MRLLLMAILITTPIFVHSAPCIHCMLQSVHKVISHFIPISSNRGAGVENVDKIDSPPEETNDSNQNEEKEPEITTQEHHVVITEAPTTTTQNIITIGVENEQPELALNEKQETSSVIITKPTGASMSSFNYEAAQSASSLQHHNEEHHVSASMTHHFAGLLGNHTQKIDFKKTHKKNSLAATQNKKKTRYFFQTSNFGTGETSGNDQNQSSNEREVAGIDDIKVVEENAGNQNYSKESQDRNTFTGSNMHGEMNNEINDFGSQGNTINSMENQAEKNQQYLSHDLSSSEHQNQLQETGYSSQNFNHELEGAIAAILYKQLTHNFSSNQHHEQLQEASYSSANNNYGTEGAISAVTMKEYSDKKQQQLSHDFSSEHHQNQLQETSYASANNNNGMEGGISAVTLKEYADEKQQQLNHDFSSEQHQNQLQETSYSSANNNNGMERGILGIMLNKYAEKKQQQLSHKFSSNQYQKQLQATKYSSANDNHGMDGAISDIMLNKYAEKNQQQLSNNLSSTKQLKETSYSANKKRGMIGALSAMMQRYDQEKHFREDHREEQYAQQSGSQKTGYTSANNAYNMNGGTFTNMNKYNEENHFNEEESNKKYGHVSGSQKLHYFSGNNNGNTQTGVSANVNNFLNTQRNEQYGIDDSSESRRYSSSNFNLQNGLLSNVKKLLQNRYVIPAMNNQYNEEESNNFDTFGHIRKALRKNVATSSNQFNSNFLASQNFLDQGTLVAKSRDAGKPKCESNDKGSKSSKQNDDGSDEILIEFDDCDKNED